MAKTARKSQRNLILNKDQVSQKLKRMAFEIVEYNLDEKELILAGIYDKGYELARLLKHSMEEISKAKVKLVRIDIDKVNPAESEVKMDCSADELQNKCVILVDDVLNSGRTIAFSMKVLLSSNLKKLETAILVGRSHKKFPISANYMGYELSTTIDEHVDVVVGDEMGVYLF